MDSQKNPENPWYARLLGWPIVVVILILLLAAPFAVKLLN
jgi:hypothetical protein